MVTDTVIVSALTLVGIAVNSLVAFFIAKLNIQASEAAKEVKEVKVQAQKAAEIVKEVKVNLENSNAVADAKLEEIKKVSKETHGLVNSQMGIQLRLNADNSRWRADVSGKEKDIKAAEKAEELLKDHESKQAIEDARLKT